LEKKITKLNDETLEIEIMQVHKLTVKKEDLERQKEEIETQLSYFKN